MPSDWNPAQYERFKAQRAEPFWDLVALLNRDPLARAVDLGCGTGELTSAAASRLSVVHMTGIDNSPAMLAAAAPHAHPGVEFTHGEIETWTSEADHDLVLANASLQWVPHHADVLERWTAALRRGGQLAVQVPANSDHASHLASEAVAYTEPFLSAMGGTPPGDPVAQNVLTPEAYAELLYRLGFPSPRVRLQVYPHIMASSAAMVEWTKGTSLTRFFKVLPAELHDRFIADYRDDLIRRVGDRAPYLFAFKRILMYGQLD